MAMARADAGALALAPVIRTSGITKPTLSQRPSTHAASEQRAGTRFGRTVRCATYSTGWIACYAVGTALALTRYPGGPALACRRASP
jgi:hypothetical protein